MSYRLQSICVLLAFLSGFTADIEQAQAKEPAQTENTASISEIAIAAHSHYVAATECEISARTYEGALQKALDSSLFRSYLDKDGLASVSYEASVSYGRRHSRDFFAPLLGGVLGKKCLTPGLHRIAVDLQYDREGHVIGKPDVTEVPEAVRLQTRREYMQETGCLASPTTWRKFRLGLYQTLFGDYLLPMDFTSGSDVPYMKQFLQDIGDGRRTEDNYLDPECLNDTMQAIARAAGLLDEEGRFALE